jgi:hypothetical protein
MGLNCCGRRRPRAGRRHRAVRWHFGKHLLDPLRQIGMEDKMLARAVAPRTKRRCGRHAVQDL